MGTYKDLLQYLGISHGIFVIILIILFLIASFFVLLYKLGLMSSITFKLCIFPKSHILYARFNGKYDVINAKVQQVMQQVRILFKISDIFAIYYDPVEIINPNMMEAAIGVIVNDKQSHRINQFINKMNGKYKKAELPQTKCIGTRYPYFNIASLIMIINRVYPRLAKFVKDKKLQVGPGVVQIYHLASASPFVLIMTPMQNMESFLLK